VKTRPARYFGNMDMYPVEAYGTGGGEPIAVDGDRVGAAGVTDLPEGVDKTAGLAGIPGWEKARKR
jgi:hypothetical protein